MSERSPSPFFIVGADRSGTTMFRLMLNAHRALAVPRESWWLIDLFARFPASAELSASDRDEAIETIVSHERWRRDWTTSAEDARAAAGQARPTTIAALADLLFRLEVARPGVRWGDKTPEHIFHLDRLAAEFVGAQIIYVSRDPRDVYLSHRRLKWARMTSLREAGDYLGAVTAAARAEQARRPATFMHVRYEDLVRDPAGTLATVCAFLRVDYDDAMLRFHTSAGDEIAQVERSTIHEGIGRAPSEVDVGRYETDGGWRCWALEPMVGASLDHGGYPRRVPSVIAPALKPLATALDRWDVRRAEARRTKASGVD